MEKKASCNFQNRRVEFTQPRSGGPTERHAAPEACSLGHDGAPAVRVPAELHPVFRANSEGAPPQRLHLCPKPHRVQQRPPQTPAAKASASASEC